MRRTAPAVPPPPAAVAGPPCVRVAGLTLVPTGALEASVTAALGTAGGAGPGTSRPWRCPPRLRGTPAGRSRHEVRRLVPLPGVSVVVRRGCTSS